MQNIGQIAGQLVARSTASQAPSVPRPRSLTPSTMADCRAIAAWAEATMPVPVAASASRVVKRLEYLDAMLPRRSQDEQAGKLRTAAYVTLLHGHSDEALEFMVREACRRFDWFPTAKQLLGILAEYRAPRSEQAQALIECQNFADEAFTVWLGNLANGQPAGDVPEQWLRIAEERGHMRRLSDGSFVSRALYHGPIKPYVASPREVTSFFHISPAALTVTEQAQAA